MQEITSQIIKLGQSKEEVIAQLGEPLKRSLLEGREIFRYSSNLDLEADYYYFQDGKVVLTSDSLKKENLVFSQYVDKYGSPDKSFYRYKKANDLESVHVWLSQGVEVITFSTTYSSQVLRERNFSPISFEEYTSTWGKNYNFDSEVLVQGLAINQGEIQVVEEIELVQAPQVSNTNVQGKLSSNIVIIFIFISAVVLLIALLAFFRVKKRKQLPPPEVLVK